MDQREDGKVSLAERFVKAMQPLPEDHFYKEALMQSMWSIDQFAALIAGLTPENYKRGERGDTQISGKVYAKREAYATKVFRQFLDQFKNGTAPRGWAASDNRIWMSSWRYIKWVSENDIPMNQRFFNELPLSLMELYFEFQPIHIALRVASKRSRAYHIAFYLKHAEELLKELPGLTPTQVYRHPRMENIERHIRELGGRYKKRTIIESWLPKIIDLKRGRPPKVKPPSFLLSEAAVKSTS